MIYGMVKYRYRILKSYRSLLGYGYRGLKKFVRLNSYYQMYLGSIIEALKIESRMPEMERVTDRYDLRQYKRRWRMLSSKAPAVFLRLFSTLSGVKSADYVPDSLYFTHIEPMLNNREYSRSFADKNMYALLIDKSIQPPVLLRKMHGAYLNTNYGNVTDVDTALSAIAGANAKIILKASIDSQGGKSVALLESREGALFSGTETVNRAWLDTNFRNHFLLQEVVRQHPFYAAFNASSLNTLRVFTYRSVVDESVHVLHSVLRVGAPGFVVDNVSSGGKCCGVSSDGRLNGRAYDINGNSFTRLGSVSLISGTKLFKYDDVVALAKKLATRQFYSRLIGFDICVDENERVTLIELNNFDVGVDMLQFCNGPLFGRFTDEVLAYCIKKKRGFRYQIR